MAPTKSASTKTKKTAVKKGSSSSSSSGQRSREEWHQQVLTVLKQQKKLGTVSLSISKLKMLCKYSGGEPSFKNNILSKLKTQKNAIEYPQSGLVGLTDQGDRLAADLLTSDAEMTTNEVSSHCGDGAMLHGFGPR
jgi:hypothetical protein